MAGVIEHRLCARVSPINLLSASAASAQSKTF